MGTEEERANRSPEIEPGIESRGLARGAGGRPNDHIWGGDIVEKGGRPAEPRDSERWHRDIDNPPCALKGLSKGQVPNVLATPLPQLVDVVEHPVLQPARTSVYGTAHTPKNDQHPKQLSQVANAHPNIDQKRRQGKRHQRTVGSGRLALSNRVTLRAHGGRWLFLDAARLISENSSNLTRPSWLQIEGSSSSVQTPSIPTSSAPIDVPHITGGKQFCSYLPSNRPDRRCQDKQAENGRKVIRK